MAACLPFPLSTLRTSTLLPLQGGFGMAHTGPPTLASPGRPSQPTIISEEDQHGSASPGHRVGAGSSTDGRSQGSRRRRAAACLPCFGRRPGDG